MQPWDEGQWLLLYCHCLILKRSRMHRTTTWQCAFFWSLRIWQQLGKLHFHTVICNACAHGISYCMHAIVPSKEYGAHNWHCDECRCANFKLCSTLNITLTSSRIYIHCIEVHDPWENNLYLNSEITSLDSLEWFLAILQSFGTSVMHNKFLKIDQRNEFELIFSWIACIVNLICTIWPILIHTPTLHYSFWPFYWPLRGRWSQINGHI